MSGTKGISTGRDINKRLSRARGFIDQFYHQPIKLNEIAGSAFFSQFHFLRLFRNTYNKTPHEYLTYRRIVRAKHLIANTNISITKICYMVGFNSLGTFSELFKKQTGTYPLKYRNNSKLKKELYAGTPKAAIPYCFALMNNLEEE